ncbi:MULTISPECIES: TetR/AcrR family transcriptional regulator [Paraburkholderia]|uniref:TetR/AcrR family transcriptional regulator n=1 Tax=Paraburkholderia TaxID=1822464 RepID=UPI00224E6CD0|nr:MULTISPECIES: TetR/AcrR family transcriptional regulator [Paraburkholderia]MCX4164920.1 TetR/AcrR family transcriptional regulator [Paraburkholderia megapolitana]MDN7160413.1 TetR/AcrR family transcriptional regulator [Paraburkholderia sp. CHISQ3]MDQ6497460.1 TetR/AcrR family transcriptional regulator [Paraburkholderia megapolitana]
MATTRSAANTLKPKERKPRVAATPPRRPGRPTGSARGPEQRARLLDVALELFARQGIFDTTLGAIAREAGFTPAMVHYYFKTREQLIDVLIDERFLPLRAELGNPFGEHPDDPLAGITQLARRLVDVSSRYPWFPALWIREVITEGGLLRQRMFERFGDAHQKESVAAIARWQKAGRLNADIEPSLVFLTVLGLTILPLATSKMWRNDPVRKSLTANDIARHAVALLTHGAGPQRG